MTLLAALVGLAMIIFGSYKNYQFRKYDFQHRTIGGVVEHPTYNAMLWHRFRHFSYAMLSVLGMLVLGFAWVAHMSAH